MISGSAMNAATRTLTGALNARSAALTETQRYNVRCRRLSQISLGLAQLLKVLGFARHVAAQIRRSMATSAVHVVS
jgi:hypothetical protein